MFLYINTRSCISLINRSKKYWIKEFYFLDQQKQEILNQGVLFNKLLDWIYQLISDYDTAFYIIVSDWGTLLFEPGSVWLWILLQENFCYSSLTEVKIWQRGFSYLPPSICWPSWQCWISEKVQLEMLRWGGLHCAKMAASVLTVLFCGALVRGWWWYDSILSTTNDVPNTCCWLSLTDTF